MAEQEVENLLKSLNADVPTYINFINNSSQTARAWWLDYSGNPISYGDIRPGESKEMMTFLTHPWVFRTSDYGAKLLANIQEVYYPVPTDFEDGSPVYISVIVTTPVYSLQEYCCTLIRKLVKMEDYAKLGIPEELKKDLIKTPNLKKQLEMMASVCSSPQSC